MMGANFFFPVGGVDHPFLAFVNTVDDDGKTREQNLFADADGLADLLRDAGFVIAPKQAAAMPLDRLMVLREAAYAVLSAVAARRAPPAPEAEVLEAAIKQALAASELGFARDGLDLAPGRAVGLSDILALALFDFTTSPDFSRLSECRRCTRLFIDRGRGRGRRWCDMARCGNRAKAESFRARKRSVKPA